MARTRQRFTVALATIVSRVHLRVLSDRGAERAEFTMSLEEFNQLFADCQVLDEQLRRGLLVTPHPKVEAAE